MPEFNRLQLGAGDVTRLPVAAAEIFLRPGWVHLGDKQDLPVEWQGRLTEWFWHPGDKLPFEDESFDFVFSEHLFEHLNPPDAAELFGECRRVMRMGAVIRTAVPDADLRPEPEPLDYCGWGRVPVWTDARRHKARWNVYFLSWVLELSGFVPVPISHYDAEGNRVEEDPRFYVDNASRHRDLEMCRSLAYVKRRDSLIVDGVKT